MTGVPRAGLGLILAGIAVISLFLHLVFGYGGRFACCAIGIVYPVYKSVSKLGKGC